MKKINWIFLTVVNSFLFGYNDIHASNNDSSKVSITVPAVEALISKMTLEEKVGQMAQVTLDVITKGESEFVSDEPLELDMSIVRKAILEHHVGSILNTANNRARTREVWHALISQIQNVAVKESRLGIPIIYGIDAIHGTTYTAGATFFPQQIAQAATWNKELVRRGAEITAYETRASSIPWNFSPVLDLGRDPRFPRMWETFGEDPFLAKTLGVEMIKGYEGEANDVGNPVHVASTLKHFLGYSVPVSGKDRTPAFIPEIELRERHIPVFEAAIKAGAHSVMVNSGIINGEPVHASYDLLTKLLKKELKFDGVVVTDWKDIENLHDRDKVASSQKEAVRMAINAGVDMSMIPYNFKFCDYLVELVKEEKVSMKRIDDAVRRILTLKYKLGLFEKPVTNYKDYPRFGSDAFEADAYQAAAEAITLLKNYDNVLPLPASAKVLVTGPNANSMRSLNGGWSYSWQGEKVEEFAAAYNTIVEAIQKKIGAQNVVFYEGVKYNNAGKYWEEEVLDIEKITRAAKEVDYIILCLGENSYTEKPGDLHDLALSENQLALAKVAVETGKPVILVLNEGRPRLIRTIEPEIRGIVQSYLPGNFGGDAIAAVLFGDINPSGKLPYTYPMFANTLVNYDHKPSEEQNKMVGVYDYESDFAIQYPFGYGLSYTQFTYEGLSFDGDTLNNGESLRVTVSVKNVGSKVGKEVVQLYLKDLYASLTPDVKKLRGFEKISLKPGETKEVSFVLQPIDLAFVGKDLKHIVQKGTFEIQIGDQKKTFEVKEDQVFEAKERIL